MSEEKEKLPFYLLLNRYRVFPRLLTVFYGYVFYKTFVWFMSLPDPTAEQSAFAATVVGAAAAFFKFYVESGNFLNPNNKGVD